VVIPYRRFLPTFKGQEVLALVRAQISTIFVFAWWQDWRCKVRLCSFTASYVFTAWCM